MSVERFFGDVLETEDIKEMLELWVKNYSRQGIQFLGYFEYFDEEYIVDEMDYYGGDLRTEPKQIQVKERDILLSLKFAKGSAYDFKPSSDGDEVYVWYRGSHVKSLFANLKHLIDNWYDIVNIDNYILFYGDFEFITVEAHGHAVTCN